MARLTASPAQGLDPLVVTVSAATSSTFGSPIQWYSFAFGDGSFQGPQATATASHTYSIPGTYTATVTVRDTSGVVDTATASVNVTPDAPPVARLTLQPSSDYVPMTVTANASQSTDTDGSPIASYSFDCGNGTITGPQAGSTATCSYPVAGTYTVTVLVTDTTGHVGTASAVATARADVPPTARLSVPNGQFKAPVNVVLDASQSTDPDKTPIASYRFVCGNGQVFGPQTANKATCRYTATGNYNVSVTVTDTLGQSATATDVVRVKK